MADVQAAEPLRSLSDAPSLSAYLADLWQRRQFTWSLAAGSMRGQHLDTLLGNVWHVLNPLLLVTVYYVVFGLLLGTDRGMDNFIGFLSIGVFTYAYSQRTITACGSSISNNIGLVRSLQFPRAVLPISTVIQALLGYGFAFGVMLVITLITGEGVSLSWLLAPVIVLLLTVFSAGLGLIVARMTDAVRDVQNVLPYVFRIFFYISAIIFPLKLFVTDTANIVERTGSDAETVRQLFVFNPFFTYIELLRDSLMTTYEAEHVVLAWTVILIGSPLTLVVGLLFFRGGEKQYGRG